MKPWRPKSWPLRAMLCALLSLITVAPRAEAANENPPEGEEGHQSEQGTRLHGTVLPGLDRLSFSMSNASNPAGPVTGVKIEQGQLKSTAPALQGTGFVNVKFTATVNNVPVTLRIAAAQPHTNVYGDVTMPSVWRSNTVWEYRVKWSVQGGSEKDLCPNGTPALALPGTWNGSTYTHGTNDFAFACLPYRTTAGLFLQGGVAAKCVEWGYAPWPSTDKRLDGTTVTFPPLEAIRHYVTCTAMASADFCGEGKPNTLNGTPLTLFHAGNVKTQPGADSLSPPFIFRGAVNQSYYFEAAWGLVDAGTGAPIVSYTALGASPRVRAQALCLTKKRWATLPPSGSCSIKATLPDPRGASLTDPNRPKFCDDSNRDDLKGKGAVLFSYSKYLDGGLYRFKRNNTDQYIVTSMVEPGPTNGPLYVLKPESRLTPSDFQLDGGVLSFEGPLIKADAPAALVQQLGLRKLLRYPNKLDSARSITLVEGMEVPGEYDAALPVVEGYVQAVFAPSGPRPLQLWLKGSTYRTSTSSNLQGYLPLTSVPMGYMPSLADYAASQP